MKKIIGLLLTIIIISATTSVFAATTYNMKLKAETTEIEVGQEKIVFYIDLTQYSGDGILGYEGILEFDKDVFESALVESLNSWDKATYDTTTGKIISTTSDAESGKDIAKITLTLKNDVNEDETEIKLNNFTLSDGNSGDTFNEKITYTFKKSTPNTSTDTNTNTNTNTNTTNTVNTNTTTTENTNNQQTRGISSTNTTTTNTNTTTSNETNRSSNTTSGNTNSITNTTNTINNTNTTTNTNTVENTATPVETTIQASSKTNTVTITESSNKKIETVGELKEDDATKAQNKIPQTGSTIADIIIIVLVGIIGVAGFIKFKTIKLK